MAIQQAKIDFEPQWKGWLSRRQVLDLSPMYATVNTNVEYYGGAVSKRLGTQYMTGWGSIALAGWSTTTGSVLNAAGFRLNDLILLTDGTPAGTVASIVTGVVANTITVTPPWPRVPQLGDALIVRRPLNGTARIDGLFQAVFRNERQFLLAACGDGLFDVQQYPALSTRLPEAFPGTTVDVTWTSTSTGTLTTVETVRAEASGLGDGERIRIAGAGVAHGEYEGRVVSVNFATRTIVVTPATSFPPVAGAAVTFFPTRVPGDTHFVQYANLTHIVSATTPPVTWDGTVLHRHGLLPPIEVPVPTLAGAGNVFGLVNYRIKYRSTVTGEQSEPGPVMPAGIDAGVGSTVNVPVYASPDPQVDKIEVYRTTSGGDGVWFFVGDMANVTGTFVDNVADAGLGVQMREFVDNVIPDGVQGNDWVRVIALWPGANRLVGITRTMGAVVFSDAPDVEEGFLKSESWPVDNEILVNYDDGDQPTAVLGFYDSLLVFKEHSLFRVKGVPPDLTIEPVIFRQDATGAGTYNQKTVVVDQNELVFPSKDGYYLINRYQGVQQGFQSDRISLAIDDEFARLSPDAGASMHAVFFRARRQVRFWMPTEGRSEPSETFVYQFEGSVEGVTHGWARWTIPVLPSFVGLGPFILDVSRLDLTALGPGSQGVTEFPRGVTASCVLHSLGGTHIHTARDQVAIGTLHGDVLLMDTGTADGGALPYEVQYRTVFFAPAGKGIVSRGRSLNIAILPTTPVSFTVQVYATFMAAGDFMIVPAFPGGGFILDIDQLDIGRLGPGTITRQHRLILLALGQYHAIEFVEQSNLSAWSILNWTYWYQALGHDVEGQTIVQTGTPP